jgi:hypothetical protein
MRHCDDLDAFRAFTKNDQVGKPVEHCSAGIEFVQLIPLRMLRNLLDGAEEFIQELREPQDGSESRWSTLPSS